MINLNIADIDRNITEEFSKASDWFELYEMIIASGKAIQGLADEDRTEENAVPGCQSNVWLKIGLKDGRMMITADSDASITRGILSLVLRVLDGQRPQDILDAELRFLDDIGLRTNLSPSRSDGLNSIIHRIKESARMMIET